MATSWKKIANSIRKTHLWNSAASFFHEIFTRKLSVPLVLFSKDAHGSDGYSEDYEDEDQADQTSCDASNDDAITSC